MKKPLIILSLILGAASGAVAQNFVANFDFAIKEPGTGCPNQTGFSNGRPAGWLAAPFHGFTPDYFHPCSSFQYNSVSNWLGCEYPKSGSAYTGLLAFDSSDPSSGSEYIYQQLPTPLMRNQRYYIEFWVSFPDNPSINFFSKRIGMFLTHDIAGIPNGAQRGLHHLTPQVPNSIPTTAYNTVDGWQKISGFFTPNVDNVQHIIIGNFDPGINSFVPPQPGQQPDVSNLGLVARNTGNPDWAQSYYYIDAVTITRDNQPVPDYTVKVNPQGGVVCTTQSTFTINNPYGTNASWFASPASYFVTSSGTGPSATLQATSNNTSQQATLTFTLSGPCNTPLAAVSSPVWVGKPNFQTPISGPSQLVVDYSGLYQVANAGGATGPYSWTIQPNWYIYTSGPYGGGQAATVVAKSVGFKTLTISTSNACGSASSSKSIEGVASCPSSMSVYPNPSKGGDVVINLIPPPPGDCDPPAAVSSSSTTESTLVLQNIMGEKSLQKTFVGTETELKGLGLKPGIYYLKIQYEGQNFEQKLFVE